MRLLGLVLALLTGGCSTTAFEFPQSQGAQRWIHERASFYGEVLVETAPRGSTEQPAKLIVSTSPTDIRFKTRDDRIIPLEQVRQIVVVRRGLSAAQGALLGAAIGIVVGATVGYSRNLDPYEASMDCTIICSHHDAAVWSGAMYGTLGLLLGAGVGALVGNRDILTLK
jgi:hypothetical protein